MVNLRSQLPVYRIPGTVKVQLFTMDCHLDMSHPLPTQSILSRTLPYRALPYPILYPKVPVPVLVSRSDRPDPPLATQIPYFPALDTSTYSPCKSFTFSPGAAEPVSPVVNPGHGSCPQKAALPPVFFHFSSFIFLSFKPALASLTSRPSNP